MIDRACEESLEVLKNSTQNEVRVNIILLSEIKIKTFFLLERN
jgi:hypothetical protein